MDAAAVVALLKERLGIRSTVRDTYLTAIAKAVIQELGDEKGIVLKADDDSHLLFVCDYAAWRYQSRDSTGAMPRDLQFRLHNMLIHAALGGVST